jgi:cytosine/adenosine deaminase-related metal-dependent hydrolase
MLGASARRASSALSVTLGSLRPGAEADVVITDYVPATPLTGENAAGHLFFGMDSRHVRDVLIGGTWAMRDRVVGTCDERGVRAESVKTADGLWRRMSSIP